MSEATKDSTPETSPLIQIEAQKSLFLQIQNQTRKTNKKGRNSLSDHSGKKRRLEGNETRSDLLSV
jgi:hypothetical protein